MRSIPLMMTIIGIAFSLVILGLYLYQTAPDNNTTNLPESASIVLPAVSFDSDSSGNKPDDATDTDDSSAPGVEESSSTDPAPDPATDAATDTESGDAISLSVELVNVSPDGTVVISGRSAPHHHIDIFNDDDLLAEATANAKGDWVAVPDAPLAPGNYLLTIRGKDADGVETMADMAIVIVIPDDPEATPLVALLPTEKASNRMAELIQSPFSEGADSQITVTDAPVVSPELPQENQVLSSDEGSSLAKPDVIVPKITIRMIEAISPDQMVVSGSIEGEGSVEVMIANTLAVTNIEDDSYMAKAAIPAEDRFAVAVSMSDEEGTILSSAKIVLNKSKLDETLSGNALIVVQKGDALWRIAYKTYGQGIRYVDIYQSNQKEIGDPNLIYPDQVFVVPNP